MRDRGSATIEFALVLPVALLVLVTAVEVVVTARVQLELGHAAREAARVAATTPDIELSIEAARRSLGAQLSARTHVAVVRQQHVGGTARVTLTTNHPVVAPILGGFTVSLRSSAVMRVER